MMERIRLHGGHQQLSIAGFTYVADDSGAFEVPAELAGELIRVHGGEVDPGVERLEERVKAIESEIGAAKNLISLKADELKEAVARLDAYKKKQADAATARLAAANAAVAAQKTQQNGNQQTLGVRK